MAHVRCFHDQEDPPPPRHGGHLVAASGASAANQSTPPASSADLQLKGAYAYIENFPHVKQPYIAVVFRTTGKLERRVDGLVRREGLSPAAAADVMVAATRSSG